MMRHSFSLLFLCLLSATAMAQEASTVTGSQAEAASENCINGHAYVDLGLSVKWATCNVGASSPADYGDYFAWGETMTKDVYTEKTMILKKKKDYHDIGGDDIYDAATANWGDTWRMPTKAEFQELIDECTWNWTTQSGCLGYMVTSKKNGVSIFLPAAGYLVAESHLNLAEKEGHYYSSSSCGFAGDCASCLYFDNSVHQTGWARRLAGLPVRPVSK